ncbi:MAG TPA: 6-phosphogluconolactonase [Candidatus Angelobacter sp.]|nr:6-phosphogluconolactonase [Candidatus Angelobacter sp.]
MANDSSSSPSSEIRIADDAASLNRAAVDEFARCARNAIDARGKFCVALASGSTPRGVYSLLAEDDQAAQHANSRRLPWDKVFFFFGDERHVPPTDVESNYRMASEALLSKVPIPTANIFRVMAEQDANSAATQYEDTLRSLFQLGANQWPRFDLIFLGIGPDGHTASLFPDSPALKESSRMVAANWVEKFQSYRITFTFPVLNHAEEVVFLVSGDSKAEIILDILQGQRKDAYPCQHVHPVSGKLLWMLDRGAAKLLA